MPDPVAPPPGGGPAPTRAKAEAAPAPVETFAVVHEPFDDYAKGDAITSAAKLARILNGPHAGHVLTLPAAKKD